MTLIFGILSFLGGLLFLMALAGAGFSGAATVLMARFLRQASAKPHNLPSVTILRPMKGLDPEAEANLLSLADQDYQGRVQIVLGADSEDDPSVAAAGRLKDARPDRDISVAADPTQHGTNRKLSNLINMAPRAAGEILVISDSDVRLPPGAVSALVGALQQPGTGLAYALYRGRPTGNLWSRIAALDINARFASSVVVGQAVGAHPVLGPTMAVWTEALHKGGGFKRLKDVLADDFELGRMMREQGLSIACPPMLIDHGFPERTLGELWRHEMRWARTIRLLNPGGYIGSVITYVTPLALIGALLTGFSSFAVTTLIALAVVRLALAALSCLEMKAGLSVVWLFPLRDVLAFAVFVAAFFGDGVEWRGARLRVKPDGAMASPSMSETEILDKPSKAKTTAMIAAVAGLVIGTGVIAYFNAGKVLAAVAPIGWGGFLAVIVAQVALFAPLGLAWWVVDPNEPFSKSPVFMWGRIAREAASDVLPFSQVGGLVISARCAVLGGVSAASAFGSNIVDVTMEMVAQILYTLLGIALLVVHLGFGGEHSKLLMPIVGSVGVGLIIVVSFIATQRKGLSKLGAFIRRLAPSAAEHTEAMTQVIEDSYNRPMRLVVGLILHMFAWFGGAAGTWLILDLMGHPLPFLSVVAIESLLFAARNAAFIVPSGLGVQEGVYALVGPLFGLPAEAALALSLLKRGRDLAIGVPVLLSWQLAEGKRSLFARRPSAT